MALKGQLQDIRLTQFLNLVKLARKTGCLSLRSPQGNAVLYFREGKLIHAALTKDAREEPGGDLYTLLVRSGKVQAHQIDAIFPNGASADDKQLGMRLINAGLVSRNDILRVVRKNMLDVVYETLTWEEGAFEFHPNAAPAPERLAVPITLDNIILEGDRHREEMVELKEELPSLDIILRFAEGPRANLVNINLSPEEWRVISFINPRHSVADIARYSGLSEFETRRIVHKLLKNGLVEVAGKAEASPAGNSRSGTRHTRPTTSRPQSRAQTAARPAMKAKRPDVEKSVVNRLIKFIRGL
ncbi:hypothetical protein ARMA_2532 [Ardenticatena maritima]|uniref:PatA-like N-terminal domain-containing protein n=1 Tax=Ardenticatena maritima TaxID=872965 RepID=A0A0M8KB34_9CHLR|nr:DUF4388 domain-containing protein [Ardenticatena maritima]KPL86430.1 hypothetical protein SE16_14115 [Ardenticatena maritima]GAP64109.1 hypothetical protein ARMA_2532 [Ardenticatena maritima]